MIPQRRRVPAGVAFLATAALIFGQASAFAAPSSVTVTGLAAQANPQSAAPGAGYLWVGLKNSDDQGTQFDVQVELVRNGAAIASSLTRCLTGLSRGQPIAKQVSVPWGAPDGVRLAEGDVIRISARIGTNANDTKCSGPGGSHNSAVGLRLYYDAASRASYVYSNVGDLYLHSDGSGCEATGVTSRFLDTTAPTGTVAKCKDSGSVKFAGGNKFSVVGTWTWHQIVYAAPNGTGSACTKAQPCSVPGAQQLVREILSNNNLGEDLVVELADGTYRLSQGLEFGPADSGLDGHQVIWGAAPGAHPVLSGGFRVTGWQQVDADKNIWEAAVPESLNTRQVYVDGKWAPIAATTPAEQGITGFSANGTVGQTTTPATWGPNLLAQIGAAKLARVEFVWNASASPWTQPRCRLASLGATGGQLVMQQPCWQNNTAKPTFSQPSGGLPNMSRSQVPVRIENAYPFLHAGQWYLDLDRHVLDYIPLPGQDMATVDVEAPAIDGYLVRGTGTLDNPVQNITFTGLQFSYATWTAPSEPTGWAEIQSNLRLTYQIGTQPQFTCTFGTPTPGKCPFGNLDKDLANVQFSYAHNINFLGNVFSHLGGAGLSFDYGSQHNTIEGNIITDISGVGIILGDTLDPHPSDVGMDDREIISHNTIANNVIHGVGVDYKSAPGIEIFFTQHTNVVHNYLYDMPYTAISAGVVQGHVDNSAHPENTTNINSDNNISFNLFHNFMNYLLDGGVIYVEGHQAMTKYLNPDGTLDYEQTLAHGLLAQGNVAYGGPNNNYVWYDDAGSEWINWTGNVEWQAAGSGEGGCEPTGYIWYTDSWAAQRTDFYTACNPGPIAGTTFASGNTVLPLSPGAAELPLDVLASAGPVGPFRSLVATDAPSIAYAHSPVTGIAPAPSQMFVAGDGFAADTQVSFAGTPATDVTILSPWFLVATAPAGADLSQLTVTTQYGSASIAAPTVTSISPSSRGQGASNQTIAVTGTGFVAGAGLAASFSGTGITVSSTTFVSATQVNARITIAAGADTTARDVTVTNSNGMWTSCSACFTVNPSPTITSLSPTSVSRAGGGTRTLTVTGTNFGATPTASFSSSNGISGISVTWNSDTSLSVTFTIATSATISTRTLTITNPDGGRATATFAVTA